MVNKCVLGIDVGLKTLAVCVFDTRIRLWNVYNVLEEEVKMCSVCTRPSKYISGFCGFHVSSSLKLKKNQIKTKKVKSYSLHETAKKIITFLEKLISENIEIFDEITQVVIELQLKLNARMCFASNMIFAKLSDHFLESNTSIKFEKASAKLKKFAGDKGTFVENTYANRKMKSVEYVRNTLVELEETEMLKYFSDLKKKDDASDSFLLAYNNAT
jgi:hypothetical protein